MVVVVVIDCDGTPYTIHMRMERLIKNEDVQMLSSSSKAPAQDVLMISRWTNHDFVSRCACAVVGFMTFTSLPLYDFCRLLFLLSDISPSYQLFKHQCYWFCWIIKKASEELWESTMDAGPAKHLDGRFGNTLSRLGRDSESLRILLERYRALPAHVDTGVDGDGSLQDAVANLQEELDKERERSQAERERAQAELDKEQKRAQELQAKVEHLEAQFGKQ